MKKTYQNPETDYMAMSVEQLLEAASPVENGFDLDKPIGETTETSGNLSRRSIWDDDADEEY